MSDDKTIRARWLESVEVKKQAWVAYQEACMVEKDLRSEVEKDKQTQRKSTPIAPGVASSSMDPIASPRAATDASVRRVRAKRVLVNNCAKCTYPKAERGHRKGCPESVACLKAARSIARLTSS